MTHPNFADHSPQPSPPWFDRLSRSPGLTLQLARRPDIVLQTDRVRARPALTPQLSMGIGMTAIGLGLWGALFPRSVKRTLGVRTSVPMVRLLFGVRELWTGYSLAGDPTRSGVLWTRAAADLIDLVVLTRLSRGPGRRGANARRARTLVLGVTLMDVVAAWRLTGVRRNGRETGGES